MEVVIMFWSWQSVLDAAETLDKNNLHSSDVNGQNTTSLEMILVGIERRHKELSKHGWFYKFEAIQKTIPSLEVARCIAKLLCFCKSDICTRIWYMEFKNLRFEDHTRVCHLNTRVISGFSFGWKQVYIDTWVSSRYYSSIIGN